MGSPTADDVIQAFVQIVRDELVAGESLHVPGLGTFAVEHRPSETIDPDDGPVRMRPPRDVVTFQPDD
jgi:DNA-binding protein HU-beta